MQVRRFVKKSIECSLSQTKVFQHSWIKRKDTTLDVVFFLYLSSISASIWPIDGNRLTGRRGSTEGIAFHSSFMINFVPNVSRLEKKRDLGNEVVHKGFLFLLPSHETARLSMRIVYRVECICHVTKKQ